MGSKGGALTGEWPSCPPSNAENLLSARSRAASKGDFCAPPASAALGRCGGPGGGDGASSSVALKGDRERPSTACAAGRRGESTKWRPASCCGDTATSLPSPPSGRHCDAASGFIVVAAIEGSNDDGPKWGALRKLVRAGVWAFCAALKRCHTAPMARIATKAPTAAPAIAPADIAPLPPVPPPPPREGRADGSAATATVAVKPPASALLLTLVAVKRASTTPHSAGDGRQQAELPQAGAPSCATSAFRAVEAADARSAMSPTMSSALTSGSGGMNTVSVALAPPASASRR